MTEETFDKAVALMGERRKCKELIEKMREFRKLYGTITVGSGMDSIAFCKSDPQSKLSTSFRRRLHEDVCDCILEDLNRHLRDVSEQILKL